MRSSTEPLGEGSKSAKHQISPPDGFGRGRGWALRGFGGSFWSHHPDICFQERSLPVRQEPRSQLLGCLTPDWITEHKPSLEKSGRNNPPAFEDKLSL